MLPEFSCPIYPCFFAIIITAFFQRSRKKNDNYDDNDDDDDDDDIDAAIGTERKLTLRL